MQRESEVHTGACCRDKRMFLFGCCGKCHAKIT